MPSNLLILPLLAGFCFAHRCYFFKFRAQLLDGYRLLLYCSVIGSVLLGLSRLVIWGLELSPVSTSIESLWHSYAPIEYLGTSTGALILGIVLPVLLNRFTSPETRRAKEINDHGDSLMQLLQKADVEERLLSISLESRKWYVGWIAEAPNLRPTEKYFKILPVLSGYRDKDSLVAKRTISYQTVFETASIDVRDFVITLPLNDVKTANLFDPAVYEDHFAE